MVLALITGASAIGSPAQARTETFAQSAETIRRNGSGNYSNVPGQVLSNYPDSGGTIVGYFYVVISIPGNKLYNSANIDYLYSVGDGSGLPVNISLMSSRPTIDAAGFNQIATSSQVGSLTLQSSSGSGTASLSAGVVSEMNRLSAQGGGELYLGVYLAAPSGRNTASLGQFNLTAELAVPPPTVTTLSPNVGPTSGVYSVTLTGTNLADATDVSFGGVPGAITGRSSTSLQIYTPALYTARTVDVVVTTPGGSATLTNGFTAVDAPTLSSVSPNVGSRGGGQTVTLTGTKLTGASAVSFGGGAASNVVVDSPTQIRATTPVRWDGAMDLVVTTPGGTATLAGGYTYVSPTVAITSPAQGSTVTPSAVTVTGTAANAASVEIFLNSVSQGTVPIVNGAWSHVLPGSLGNGSYTLLAQATDGQLPSPLASVAFTVAVPSPQIFDRQPTGGPASGGYPVVITGLNLTGATGVAFGSSPVTRFTVDSDTQITATAPSGSGHVDVSVTTAGGSSDSSSATSFVYIASPTISAVSPTAGPTIGGDQVIITGTGLDGATGVTFGGVPGTITASSPTTVTATSPSHAAGAVDVTVTTPGGSDASRAAYIYEAASSDSFLTNLAVSSGTLSPAFASGTTGYALSVANGVSSLVVTPTVSQASATVTVDGATVASGVASDPVSLDPGANTVIVTVTAADRTTTRSYVLTVTRAAIGPVAAVPTLSEWAMMLFGLLLAGGAAFVIQRRSPAA